MLNEQRQLWFAGALFTFKVIQLGADKFYRRGEYYIWERDGGAMVVYNPYWLYPVFVEACNSYGMLPEDVFFGELLGIPHSLEN